MQDHRDMTKKMLLKDVAQLAGVSEMTASRALRGAPDVWAYVRGRIKPWFDARAAAAE